MSATRKTVKFVVSDVEARVGPIDVLVNCAGITRDGTFRKMDFAQWKAVLDTNLDSMFNVTHPVVGGMMERVLAEWSIFHR